MNILVLPDVQAKPGNDFTFLKRIGTFIVKKKPDVIVCIGDFADMESLSSYDKGKKSFEGRRVSLDFQAAHEAMDALLGPINEHNKKMKATGHKQYKPRKVMCLGNHEDRVSRAINEDAKLEGLLSLDQLEYKERGWEVHPFLDVVTIGGVAFSHYFQTGVMGRPAASAQLQLNKKHMSCVAGHQQGLQMATGFNAEGHMLTSIIAGSCLTSNHKVLTSDLQYKPLGEMQVGDTLVSFDEEVVNKRSRRYKKGTILAMKKELRDVFEVTLQSGKKFTTTSDHRWLVKSGSKYYWKTTDTLRKGTCIPKLFDEWSYDPSREAGWLEGMYEGEGSLYQRVTTGGTSAQLSICQNEGPVLERLRSVLEARYGNTSTYAASGRNCRQLRLSGGTRNIAKLLGEIRPKRLLDKFNPESLGRINSPDVQNDKVVSIYPAGKQEIVQIDIDAKTMIVEGYPHHNCYEHNEDYMGAQGNNHWRGFLMMYGVDKGQFDAGYISLGYINSKYKGVV